MARRLLTILAFSLSATFSLAASPSDTPQDAAAASIRPAAIRAHIRFLADDLLEGRGTGTRGHELAARYVAAQFEQLGLAPAGENGTYYQSVPLIRLELVPDECSFTIVRDGREQGLKYGEDFLMSGDESAVDAQVQAPLVFAGYGVTAPDQQYDDYAGLDARGRIVVVLYGAPSRFPSTVRAHHSSHDVKTANAVAHGAVGYVVLRTPEFEKSAPWPWMLRESKQPAFRWLDPAGAPNDARPQLRGRAMTNRSGAEALFVGAGKSLDEVIAAATKGRMSPVQLRGSARIRTVSRRTRVESPNVVGMLRGSDPRLENEYVVYTAHLDHLGIGEAVKGETIYHGAVDNASGIAVLLEIARAFASLGTSPRRSILFVAVTGEEKGLLGSDFFAHYPTVPGPQIVANMNMDGAAILYPFDDVVPLGGEHSSLGAVVEREAARMHVRVSPDPRPEEVLFIRSDQYSFVKQGVPALFLYMGSESGDPKRPASAIFQEYISARYHTPQDDVKQPLDYDAAAQYTRLNFLVGYDVAQQDARPHWNAGDFFGRLFSAGKVPTGTH